MVGKKTLTRREMLKSSATAAIAAPLLPKKSGAQKSSEPKYKFFTPAEFAILDELTEIIIPTDEHSPGARTAKVAAYIDERLAESFLDAPKTEWREGLALVEKISVEMHGRNFLETSEAQRIALVTRLAQSEKMTGTPEGRFFIALKESTTKAYYTSKIGLHQELEYKGNVYLKEYVGEDVK